ncbi:hypothetical protein SAMN03159406_03164 [Rhizobium sp. NFR03]|nr:hypothetical protein SAMN03159406_03164 [Rhizobium sp. NFR03]
MFVHNDLMLAGRYNENSVTDLLNLNEHPFIAGVGKLGRFAFDWIWKAALPYKWRFPMDPFLGSGAEKAKQYLPSREVVSKISEGAGHDGGPTHLEARESDLSYMYFYPFIYQQIYMNPNHVDSNQVFEIEYPLYGGYSDIFTVPMAQFPEWIHTMGVLASMQLFPEITIPTSLVWTFGRLNTEHTLQLKSSILWQKDRELANDINWVIDRFQEGRDYIHPVKYERYAAGSYDNLIEEISNASAMPKVEI